MQTDWGRGTLEGFPGQQDIRGIIFHQEKLQGHSALCDGAHDILSFRKALLASLVLVRASEAMVRPAGARMFPAVGHGSRRGLCSLAASRLNPWSLLPPYLRTAISAASTRALSLFALMHFVFAATWPGSARNH